MVDNHISTNTNTGSVIALNLPILEQHQRTDTESEYAIKTMYDNYVPGLK